MNAAVFIFFKVGYLGHISAVNVGENFAASNVLSPWHFFPLSNNCICLVGLLVGWLGLIGPVLWLLLLITPLKMVCPPPYL